MTHSRLKFSRFPTAVNFKPHNGKWEGRKKKVTPVFGMSHYIKKIFFQKQELCIPTRLELRRQPKIQIFHFSFLILFFLNFFPLSCWHLLLYRFHFWLPLVNIWFFGKVCKIGIFINLSWVSTDWESAFPVNHMLIRHFEKAFCILL